MSIVNDRAPYRAEAARLRAIFEAQGAVPVEPAILQPAEIMLDLYGEDIRARAYVTSDPLRGEQMLRPDFTVPVVQMHMAQGAEPARYTYAGEVFRRQEEDPSRPSEYSQVGYEVFDGTDPAAADAEVYALIESVVRPLRLKASTGDMGILAATVSGLETTERRKRALLRHIWRPRRFRALIDKFSGKEPMAQPRRELLAAADPFAGVKVDTGLRSRAEVAERLDALREEAAAAPLSRDQVELIEAVLNVRETLPFALERLRDIAVDMPALVPAVERVANRCAALDARGIDVAGLDFEVAHGRAQMEYYDGFVFSFAVEGRPDLPPVAVGGRYDALTRVLGGGTEIPAVGGVIRPGLMLDLKEGRA